MKEYEDFEELAMKLGGKVINLSNPTNYSINIFEFDEIDKSENYLKQKEKELRDFLIEANKEDMMGTKFAIDRLKNLSDLDDNPKWQEIVKNVLIEFSKLKKSG